MPGPLRIAFLTHVARFSGAEIEMLRLIENAPGIEAFVVVAEDGPLVPRLIEAGARVEVLPLAERARAMKRDQVRIGPGQALAAIDIARYSRRLHRRLMALSPDLVVAVSLKAGAYGLPVARLARIPCVWHLHDRISADYLSRQAVLPMRLLLATVPDAVVATATAPLLQVGRMRPGIRTAVIPPPVPIPPHPVRLRPRVQRIGIVGRLAPWKGQHVFLEAFGRALPESGAEAVVIGSAIFGEDDYARSLQALADRLGIRDRVQFRGFREDIPAELERLDLLVHSSVLAEPLGNVVFEAMAAGLPVIAANAGGPAEYITHGANGLLHEPGSVESLAAMLRTAVGDRALRARLAAAGRLTASEFAPAVVAPRLLELYRDVASRRKGHAAAVGEREPQAKRAATRR
ncbi:MAG: glycosyltransferase family 4 protein [Solirubrobacteraceae bacterium]